MRIRLDELHELVAALGARGARDHARDREHWRGYTLCEHCYLGGLAERLGDRQDVPPEAAADAWELATLGGRIGVDER